VKPDKQIVFKESKSRIYYHDTANRAIAVVNTVKDNREGTTDRDYERDRQAQRAPGLIGHPSTKDFNNMVCSNMIKNCPVASNDVNNANKMFGQDFATLKGERASRNPPLVMMDYIHIPKEIVDLNRNVTLTIDIMFMNGLPFMVSIS
jgi:hypothetical protein